VRPKLVFAEALKAIIGAIYLDSDQINCKKVLLSWYEERLSNLSIEHTEKDTKTRLQEYLQSMKKDLPNYEVSDITGEAHNQTFYVTCQIESLGISTKNKGSSRRIAEQKSAKEALKILGVK